MAFDHKIGNWPLTFTTKLYVPWENHDGMGFLLMGMQWYVGFMACHHLEESIDLIDGQNQVMDGSKMKQAYNWTREIVGSFLPPRLDATIPWSLALKTWRNQQTSSNVVLYWQKRCMQYHIFPSKVMFPIVCWQVSSPQPSLCQLQFLSSLAEIKIVSMELNS